MLGKSSNCFDGVEYTPLHALFEAVRKVGLEIGLTSSLRTLGTIIRLSLSFLCMSSWLSKVAFLKKCVVRVLFFLDKFMALTVSPTG